ncbi:MAG: hypothetical protein AB7S74_08110 [Hyphomicrobium sp.]
MVELPHFFGLDLSAAGPWIISGFVGGVLLSWLWRALRGTRAEAKAEAQIAEMQSLFDASKSEHQAEMGRLLSDTHYYEKALADAEQRASQSGQEATTLRAEAERLAQVELSSRNELLAVDKELAKLRSDLQWAQAQSGSLSNERASLSQQAQSIATELATLRTAAELKDSEIARLINELQWQQSKASTLEQEKYGLQTGLNQLRSDKTKDSEIARLQDELGNVRGHVSRLQDEATSSQSNYHQAWKDLTYMRNLAYWQASEVERLRALVTRFEDDAASQSSAFNALKQQYAALSARLGRQQGAGARKKHNLAYFRLQGANGTSADAHAHAKGNGKLSFVHKSRDANAKTRRRKTYKSGKMDVTGPRGTGGLRPGQGTTLIALPSKTAPGEVADLKAKLAALRDDAEKYRRLRDAVHVANRIADGQV